MREALAAVAVTATVLLVSAVGYVYVNMPGLWNGEDAPAASEPAPAAASPETVPSAGAASPPPAGG